MGELKMTLKAARINANLTQKAVAETINVKRETISSWERGISEPVVSQAIALSNLYGIPLDCLIFCNQNSLKAREFTKSLSKGR